jgi:CBS domain-containing protein
MTTVRQIMSTRLVTVEAGMTLTEAARVMSTAGSGSVLVLEDGTLTGILTERDILRALASSPNADLARVSSVSRWMSRDPMTIGPDTTVADALSQMLFGAFRHLPVVEGERILGVVSMRDLAESLAGP